MNNFITLSSISLIQSTKIFLTLLSSIISTIIITYVIRKYSIKINFYERKEERRVDRKIVRIGGLAIVISFFLMILMVNNIFPNNNQTTYIPYNVILISAFGCFLIGITDDLIYLSPWIRLLGQFAIAIFAFVNGVQIGILDISALSLGVDQVVIPYQINLIISIVFLVGMTNAINWIDGLDGLAAGVVGIISLGIMVIFSFSNDFGILLLATCTLGTCIGFLFFNFHPAKIYMGDGGSNFLGFLIAAMALSSTSVGLKTINLLGIALLNFIPILDMIVVIIERYSCGYSIFYPDNRHLHHKLLRKGLSHKQSVLTLYAYTFISVSIAICTYTI